MADAAVMDPATDQQQPGVDYVALARQYGGVPAAAAPKPVAAPAVDYLGLAKQFGGVPAKAAPVPPQGFVPPHQDLPNGNAPKPPGAGPVADNGMQFATPGQMQAPGNQPASTVRPHQPTLMEETRDAVANSALGSGLRALAPSVFQHALAPSESEANPHREAHQEQLIAPSYFAPSVSRAIHEGPLMGAHEAAPAPDATINRVEGALEAAGGLTTAGNLALMAGTGGALGAVGELSPVAAHVLGRVASAGFTVQMLKGLYDQHKAYRDAVNAGDINEAQKIQGEMGVNGVMALMSGAHATGVGAAHAAPGTEEKPVLHSSDDVEELRASAERQAKPIGDAVRAAAESVPGAKLEAVRDSKDSDRIADKADRQDVKPSQIADVAAAKVTVPDQAAADQVLANLHEQMPVESRNGEVTGEAGKNGVRQTQAVVNTGAGEGEAVKRAEVLLQTPEMAKAAEDTHDDYRKAQELRAEGKDAEADAIEAKIREVHEAAEAAAQKRQGGAKPAGESKYKFGSTQANLPEDSEAHAAVTGMQASIPDADLAGDGKDIDKPHVTVRYGLKNGITPKLRAFIESQAPFEASLGETTSFPPSENSKGASPIIAPVESAELRRINDAIQQHGEFEPSSFPDYKPHVTVAYVKPEAAEKYTGLADAKGKTFPIKSIAISDKNGEHTEIPLKGVSARMGANQSAELANRPDVAGHEGRETEVLTPTRKLPGSYRLVEAADLRPSHNAQSFEENPDYPKGVQERDYKGSKEAQARVIGQAQNYDPAYTVNTNPDAVNGPPVITPDGTVLGGNSRAMSTQRLYADGNGGQYRAALAKDAATYGLSPEQVEGMKEPVLVRQIARPATVDEASRIGSELNKSMTGALGVSERAVSAGRKLKPETLRSVSEMLQADDLTLRELLAKRGPEVLKMMQQDGAITERERPQYMDAASGGLSEEGKTFFERALLGSVIDDPRLMDAAPKGVLAKLERSLGAITSFGARPDEWNLLPALRQAVAEHALIARNGTSVDLHLNQRSMFGPERNPVVDTLVRALDEKPTTVRAKFEGFAKDADHNPHGQESMFGGGEAYDAFNHAFGSKLTEEQFNHANADAAESATKQSPEAAGKPEQKAGAQGNAELPRSEARGQDRASAPKPIRDTPPAAREAAERGGAGGGAGEPRPAASGNVERATAPKPPERPFKVGSQATPVEVRGDNGAWKPATLDYYDGGWGGSGIGRVTLEDGTKMRSVPERSIRAAGVKTEAGPPPLAKDDKGGVRADVGVDFDGTIAKDTGGKELGAAIPARIASIRKMLDEGKSVEIITRRVENDPQGVEAARIQDWLEKEGLPRLPVTDQKTAGVLYDDNAHHAPSNEDTPLVEAPRSRDVAPGGPDVRPETDRPARVRTSNGRVEAPQPPGVSAERSAAETGAGEREKAGGERRTAGPGVQGEARVSAEETGRDRAQDDGTGGRNRAPRPPADQGRRGEGSAAAGAKAEGAREGITAPRPPEKPVAGTIGDRARKPDVPRSATEETRKSQIEAASKRSLRENAAAQRSKVETVAGRKALVLDADGEGTWHRLFKSVANLGAGERWRGMTLDKTGVDRAVAFLKAQAADVKGGLGPDGGAAEGYKRLAEALEDARGKDGVATILRSDYRPDTAREEAVHQWQREEGLGDGRAVAAVAEAPEFEEAIDRLRELGYDDLTPRELAEEAVAKALGGDEDFPLTDEQREQMVRTFLAEAVEENGPEILKTLPEIDPRVQHVVDEVKRGYDYGREYDQRAERGGGQEARGGDGQAGARVREADEGPRAGDRRGERADEGAERGVQEERAAEGELAAGSGDDRAVFQRDQEAEKQNPWYLKSAKVLAEKMKGPMPGDALVRMLENAGVKADELKWSGLDQLRGKSRVTPVEVRDHLAENALKVEEVTKGKPDTSKKGWDSAGGGGSKGDGETKFGSYQLPGGENYREMLLTLPRREATGHKFFEENGSWHVEYPNGSRLGGWPTREAAVRSQERSVDNFHSGHWDEPNVLAHIRFNDRTTPDGRKLLHLEEIQSDWHQKGREVGYRGDKLETPEDAKRFFGISDEVWKGLSDDSKQAYVEEMKSDASHVRQGKKEQVPNAPFKKDWHELAFRRAVRYAAENGYDGVSWTPGEKQAERYDLSKQISEVHYSGTNLKAYDLDGKTVLNQTGVSQAELPDYIGKEAARKLMEQEPRGTLRSLSGLDLKVGGEGMKGFYDKIIPDYARKFGKQWGAKLGETDIDASGVKVEKSDHPNENGWVIKDAKWGGQLSSRVFETRAEAEEVAKGYGGGEGTKVPVLDITPDMRQSVTKEGLPMFQRYKADPLRRTEEEWLAHDEDQLHSIDALMDQLNHGEPIPRTASEGLDELVNSFDKQPPRNETEKRLLSKAEELRKQSIAEEERERGKKGMEWLREQNNAADARRRNANGKTEGPLQQKPSAMGRLGERVAEKPRAPMPVKERLANEAKASAKAAVEDTRKVLTTARDAMKAAWDGLRDIRKPPPAGDPEAKPKSGYMDAYGRYEEQQYRAARDSQKLAEALKERAPDPLTQEAMTNWIQAGGDKAQLKFWAENSKAPYKAGYERALTLTPEERAMAEDFKQYYDEQERTGTHAGLLERGGKRNYMMQIHDADHGGAGSLIDTTKLNDKPSIFKPSTYRNYFEAESAGQKPVNKGIGWLTGRYDKLMGEAIRTRALLGDALGTREKDGRPSLILRRDGTVMQVGPENEPYLMRYEHADDGADPDRRDYEMVPHPTMRRWLWQSKDLDLDELTRKQLQQFEGTDGIAMRGDIYAHPDVVKHLGNLVGKSAVRATAFGRVPLAVSQFAKDLMFTFSGTHEAITSTTALMEGQPPIELDKVKKLATLKGWANPFDMDDKILDIDHGPDAAIKQLGVRNGLTLLDIAQEEGWSEGGMMSGAMKYLGPPGKLMVDYKNFLFRNVMPKIKMKMFVERFKTDLERYKGTKSQDEIAQNTARQVNSMVGGINWQRMGVSRTAVDLARLALLAPDFQYGAVSSIGQALKPGGRQQLLVFARTALVMYGAARIINAAANQGDAKWDKQDAFRLVVNGKHYGIRTRVGDALEMANDPQLYIAHRLNPVFSRTLMEAVTRKDEYGRAKSAGGIAKDAVTNTLPIAVAPALKNEDMDWQQTFMNSFGIQTGVYHSATETLAHKLRIGHIPQGGSDAEEDEAAETLSREHRHMKEQLRDGSISPAQVWEQVGQRKLEAAEARRIIDASRMTPLQEDTRALSLAEAMKVYAAANKPEREELRGLMTAKAAREQAKHPTQAEAVHEKMTKLMASN